MRTSLSEEIVALLEGSEPVNFIDFRYRSVTAKRHFMARRRQTELVDQLDRLRAEAAGQSALVLLHNALNVALRRGINPDVNAVRFRRLWREQGAFLVEVLSLRWLISACDSFADVADTPKGAALALNGAMVGNLLKLHETERRFLSDPQPHNRVEKPQKQVLFDGMLGYRTGTDDMLKNLFQRVLAQTSEPDLPEAMLLRAVLTRLHRTDTVLARLLADHTKNHWAPVFDADRDPADDRPEWASQTDQGTWRYVVLNDTNRLLSGLHFGPALVCQTLHDGLALRGGAPMGWANTAAGFDAVMATGKPDLVVLNGEGTLHHGAPRAAELLQCCAKAHAQGIPVALINTVWQDNPPEFLTMLEPFSMIHVRESLSAKAIGDRAVVTPDLAFAALGPFYEKGAFEGPVAPLAIMDASRAVYSEGLQDLAARQNAPFFTMEARHVRRMRHRALAAGYAGHVAPAFATAPAIRGADAWITGRFHGLVAALCAGVPVLTIPSPTHKIDGLVRDVGLDQSLLPPDWDSYDAAALDALITTRLAGWSEADGARAQRYVQDAQGRISAMLDTLAHIAQGA